MGKDKNKPKQKGSDALREQFQEFGKFYQQLDSGPVKQWVGELLVLAHRLDEQCERLGTEFWQQHVAEGQLLAAQEALVVSRRQFHRYRAQRENARRDFVAMRRERDLIRTRYDELTAKYDQVMELLGQSVQAVVNAEAQKSIGVAAAIAADAQSA